MSSKVSESNEYDHDNIGIVAMECHFPKQYVSQTSLEQYDMQFNHKISAGKYTIGLGQNEMSFCSDREDIYSMALTCVDNLLTKYEIPKSSIGRLTVSTETVIDHSKSIKSVLMKLFESENIYDIEGVDMIHACYSGTAALLDADTWCKSPYWDGRYAIVVACDIAEYDKGNARMTGGAGCIAILIGKNGIIKIGNLDGKCKSSYMKHGYDFYKPNLSSLYPVVDGKISNDCYLTSLDECYKLYNKKHEKNHGKDFDFWNDADYWIFHSPYNKLVQKSFARLLYNDYLNFQKKYPNKEYFTNLNMQDKEQLNNLSSLKEHEIMKLFCKLSKKAYKAKVEDSTFLPKTIGNCYSASIFMGLLSLVHKQGINLAPKMVNKNNANKNKNKTQKECCKIGMFSYGSGICSTMYRLTIDHNNIDYCKKQLKKIQDICNLDERLNNRIERSAKYFNETLDRRNDNHSIKMGIEFIPNDDINETIFENSYYLTKMDARKQRFYEKNITMSKNFYQASEMVSQLIMEINKSPIEKYIKPKENIIEKVKKLQLDSPMVCKDNNKHIIIDTRVTTKSLTVNEDMNNTRESSASTDDTSDLSVNSNKSNESNDNNDNNNNGNDGPNGGSGNNGDNNNGNNGSNNDKDNNNGGKKDKKDDDNNDDGSNRYEIPGCAALGNNKSKVFEDEWNVLLPKFKGGELPQTKHLQNKGLLPKMMGKFADGDDMAIALTREAQKIAPRMDQCYN